MTDLERALAGLGAALDLPEAPDVSGAVLARLEGAPRRPRVSRRRALAVALVALAIAVGAAFAVPSARTAILDFFGLRGATVRRVETLPQVPPRVAAVLELRGPVPVEDGRPRAPFPDAVVPAELGPPDAAYFTADGSGGKLTLVYEPGAGVPRSVFTGVGLLVTELYGELDPAFVDKLVTADTVVERLTVADEPALWLEGGPHVLIFRDRDGAVREEAGRLAGNTLLVQRGRLLVRIEGEIERDRAVAIAESLAP